MYHYSHQYAGSSGYIYDFQISGDAPVPDEIGKSGQVVIELTKNLPAGTHLYFDNYFASPLLLLKLKEMDLESACTLRGCSRPCSHTALHIH